MAVKDGFTFYRSFYRQAKRLKPKERHQFYDNIMGYMFEDLEPTGNDYVMGAFEGIQYQLDKSLKNGANGATETKSKRNRNEIETQSKRPPDTDTDTVPVPDTDTDTGTVQRTDTRDFSFARLAMEDIK